MPIARHVRVQDYDDRQFHRALGERSARNRSAKLKFSGKQKTIAGELIPEIQQRLRFMENVGLGYLALGRSAKTLSGGESQRIRLAAQLGSNLRGVLYVLDEPTIGLHPRDNLRLLETLDGAARKRETHSSLSSMMKKRCGAPITSSISARAPELTAAKSWPGNAARYRASEKFRDRSLPEIAALPSHSQDRADRLRDVEDWIEIRGARANNLKNIDVRFPVGRLSVITGISGSGKSTLMHEVLLPAVRDATEERKRQRAMAICSSSSSGAAERSKPFTKSINRRSAKLRARRRGPTSKFSMKSGIFTRNCRSSRMRGYSASRFSFNAEGGRCETCKGQGMIKLEMNFLPSSYVPCEDCRGRRYNPQTLEVLYNEKSIGDVMEMTIEEAAAILFSSSENRASAFVAGRYRPWAI